jgi:acetaldehyde dehydrogenase (acetylating)
LIAPLNGVGRDYPLSIEKLCPVLSFYVVKDWREGCERCIQILRYGGMGHTMSIHSQNDDVILQFGLKKPAFRICVNTPTTHGSIGLTTGLDPAMTLGCGGWGGNITSDNISPRHLLNIKRLAYELRPAVRSSAASFTEPRTSGADLSGPRPQAARPLPKAPAKPEPAGIPAQALAARIDSFLESRGYRGSADKEDPGRTVQSFAEATVDKPAEFVCEDDVRAAIKAGRKVLIDEKTIVTPSARDLGESQKLFVQASWPR